MHCKPCSTHPCSTHPQPPIHNHACCIGTCGRPVRVQKALAADQYAFKRRSAPSRDAARGDAAMRSRALWLTVRPAGHRAAAQPWHTCVACSCSAARRSATDVATASALRQRRRRRRCSRRRRHSGTAHEVAAARAQGSSEPVLRRTAQAKISTGLWYQERAWRGRTGVRSICAQRQMWLLRRRRGTPSGGCWSCWAGPRRWRARSRGSSRHPRSRPENGRRDG